MLGQVLDPAGPAALRIAAAHHLAVVVRRGYGVAGLPNLLEIAASPERSLGERLLAVSGLAIVRMPDTTVEQGNNHIVVSPSEEFCSKAIALLDELAGGDDGPLQAAAAAALEWR